MRLSWKGPRLDEPEAKLPVLNQFVPFRHDPFGDHFFPKDRLLQLPTYPSHISNAFFCPLSDAKKR